ncbi:MAG: radical SAM protein, partial [Deltaproteobacteria bacterium]|nr:radical SAM protein [Deltaproteobacteria bacterium]
MSKSGLNNVQNNSDSLRVHLVSLGCPKNLVDSERLMAATQTLGFRATLEPEEADLLVVNTCAFIQAATEEAIAAIMDMAARKKPGARLAVVGCLASRYGSELSGNLPEADLIMAPEGYLGFIDKLAAWYDLAHPKAGPQSGHLAGTRAGSQDGAWSDTRTGSQGGAWAGFQSGYLAGDKFGVVGQGFSEAFGPEAFRGPFETWARYPGTPPWRSWLKIAEGCDNRCSYCLIPSLRGPLKLRSLGELLAEAEKLAGAGVKELTLVAQDLTAWSDRDKGLPDLARA